MSSNFCTGLQVGHAPSRCSVAPSILRSYSRRVDLCSDIFRTIGTFFFRTRECLEISRGDRGFVCFIKKSNLPCFACSKLMFAYFPLQRTLGSSDLPLKLTQLLHGPQVGHLHPDDSGLQTVDLHRHSLLHFFSPYLNYPALPGPLLVGDLDLGPVVSDVA